MVSPLIGTAVGVGLKFVPDIRVWTLRNLDYEDVLVTGQFEAEGVTRDIGVSYSSVTSLNREDPIRMFVSRDAETIQFKMTLHKYFAQQGLPVEGPFGFEGTLGTNPADILETLEKWTRIDTNLRRPPILQLSFSNFYTETVTLDAISGLKYEGPDLAGAFRGCTAVLQFTRFTPFAITDKRETNTRFHRVVERQTYEDLARIEYRNPIYGDVIRKQNPTKQLLKTGDIIALPSIEAVSEAIIAPTSTTFKTAFRGRETPQRARRLEAMETRSRTKVSYVIQPGTITS